MLTRPTKFGPYLLLERVSLGGMAEVFKAIEFGVEGFERTVAVKRILPHVAEDEEFITMFKDEARIAVQLQHANIAQIYNLGHEAESFYIALEYVAGRDLRTIFEGNRKKLRTMPVEQICFIMMQVCEGLDYAHNKKDAQGNAINIIHRDVSPPNILVSYEGSVKLCDFGVAKAAGRVSQTQAGILKGKFGYMSPEQVRGRSLDRRSDVFAAGVCLWELLTGKRLFHGDTDFSTLEKVRSGTVERPRSVVASIPEELESIVMDALAAEPESRIPTAAGLHDRLRGFLLKRNQGFSRKDLAAWMREQYADEIEQEKSRDRAKRDDIERFKRGEYASPAPAVTPGAPPAPELGGNQLPPPLPGLPRVSAGAVASSGGSSGPLLGGGGSRSGSGSGSVKRAPPKPRGRAKTLLNSPVSPSSSTNTASSKRKAGSGGKSGSGNRDNMAWDDDELETRLFEEPGSLAMLSSEIGADLPDLATELLPGGTDDVPLPPLEPGGEEPLARAMRLTQNAPSPEDSLGAPVVGKENVRRPSRHRPFRNAAASLASGRFGGAGSSMSQIGDMDFQRMDRRKIWIGISALSAVAVILLAWGLGSSGATEELPEEPPEVANPVPKPKTGVRIKVQPADARLTVDGAEICCGEERIADRLSPGEHKIEVDGGAAFFPYTTQVQVKQGELAALEISLSARRVQLQVYPDPSRAGVYLVEDGQSRRIGRGQTRYELRRKEGQSYLLKVSAPGHETQEIPIPASSESSQRFDVMLAPRSRSGRSSTSRSPAPSTSTGTAKASAQLKIGAKLGLPPARVFVDGKEVGKTPINLDVTPGNHRVEWRWADQRATRVVALESGDTKTVFGSP